MPDTKPRAVILMGVAGSGKTTVGVTLAKRLGWTFLDAEDFHPAANVEKMSKGIPLNDEDRMPWLLCLHDELEHRIGSGASVVLGCSALKESYRHIMQEGLSRIDFVFLDVDRVTLTERLGRRRFFNCRRNLITIQAPACFNSFEERRQTVERLRPRKRCTRLDGQESRSLASRSSWQVACVDY